MRVEMMLHLTAYLLVAGVAVLLDQWIGWWAVPASALSWVWLDLLVA